MVALEVQGSLGESSEIFITRLCKMLCRSHDDQRAGKKPTICGIVHSSLAEYLDSFRFYQNL